MVNHKKEGVMGFDFNSTQRLTNLNEAYDCLLEWSKRAPEIIECEKNYSDNKISLRITANKISEILILKEIVIRHKHDLLQENIGRPTETQLPSKTTDSFKLSMICKDDEGRYFALKLL